MLREKEWIWLLKEENIALANYRIEKAKECISASKYLLDDERYPDSANRSYYAIYHAMNAMFALAEKGFKKHSGIITNFGLDYVQTEKIEPEYGRIANRAFQIRTKTDYEDFYVVSKKEVIEQYENAVKFVDRMEKFIKEEIAKASE